MRVQEHALARHDALLYGSDEQLLATAVPFLRDGVATSAPTLLLGMDPRARRLILDALGADHGVTVLGTDEQVGPVEALRHLYQRYDALPRDQQIRALGNVSDTPWPAWARLEAWIDHFLVAFPVWSLCAYDTRSTEATTIADVQSTHRCLYDGAPLTGRSSPTYVTPERFLEQKGRAELARLHELPPVVTLRDPSPTVIRQVLQHVADEAAIGWDDANAIALSASSAIERCFGAGDSRVHVDVWVQTRMTVLLTVDGPHQLTPFSGLLRNAGDELQPPDLVLDVIYDAVDDVAIWCDDVVHIRLAQPVSPRVGSERASEAGSESGVSSQLPSDCR